MNPSRRLSIIFSFLLFLCSMSACTAGPQVTTASPTPTPAPTQTMTLLPSIPPPAPPTSTNTAIPIPTDPIPVSFAPDGLRMAYALDGNLYFQDGNKPPLQLTQNKQYRHPIGFSENGEKIFFEEDYGILYSIHVDGSNEQPLITSDLLPDTPEGDVVPTEFCEPILVPHSPFIFFRTCTHPAEATTVYQGDLYSLDTDAREVKLLLPRGYAGGYRIPSPDGKKLAMNHLGYIDILRIDGRMIKHKLANYTVSEPYPLAPLVFWTADSSNLILALPINKFYDSSPPPTYEVWQYSLDTGAGTKISLDPLPSGYDPVWASPDGKWILYSNNDEPSFYLVDLSTGHSQVYEPGGWNQPCEWSPDGMHFAYDGELGISIGSINGPPVHLVGRGKCTGWLDENRFIYLDFDHDAYVMKDIQSGESTPILTGNIWQFYSYDNLVFYPPLKE